MTFAPLMLTVPPTGLLTAVIVRTWPPSFGPAESLASRLAKLIVRGPLSSATLLKLSLVPVGASLISLTVMLTVAEALVSAAAHVLGATGLQLSGSPRSATV